MFFAIVTMSLILSSTFSSAFVSNTYFNGMQSSVSLSIFEVKTASATSGGGGDGGGEEDDQSGEDQSGERSEW